MSQLEKTVGQIKEEKEEMMLLIKEEKGEHPSHQTNVLNVKESVTGKFYLSFLIYCSCKHSIRHVMRGSGWIK